MAVKVMWAPARIAAEAPKPVEPAPPASAGAAAKPKRRKTSIYDADGNEVFITLLCLKCHQMRPLSAFGLRKMADGAIRNQPWCRPCRSDASPKKRKDPTLAEDSSVSGESRPVEPAPVPGRRPEAADLGNLAAEVATALYRGRV